ncbi:hypothetical protein ABW19_dt0203701 [Dactylella cylindrospora]|nr:hypothetical protein ABW19_dt0203701 [Dactylella cylindrospora]
MNPSSWAVFASLAIGAWESRVFLPVFNIDIWVDARWEVDVGAKWGSITVALLVWETPSFSAVVRVSNTATLGSVGVGWVKRNSFALGVARAGPHGRSNSSL